MNRKYALIGEHISHSLSVSLHAIYAKETTGYEYEALDVTAEELPAVLAKEEYSGFNVTSPHKRAVIPYLDRLSPEAEALQAVNTIRREPDGRLTGFNTDVYGFMQLAGEERIRGKKVLILGTGGAASAIGEGLRQLGAAERIAVSRHAAAGTDAAGRNRRSPEASEPANSDNKQEDGGNENFRRSTETRENAGTSKASVVLEKPPKDVLAEPPLPIFTGYCTYDELKNHLDAEVIVNATPVGMYPGNGASPLDPYDIQLADFDHLECVLDAIYNPYRPKLLLQAEELGVYARSGLRMLVFQGLQATEIWGEIPAGNDGIQKPERKTQGGSRSSSGRKYGKNRRGREGGRTARNGSASTSSVSSVIKGAARKAALGEKAHQQLLARQLNITVIGMPGSGKSSISRQLAIRMRRPFVDVDRRLEEEYGVRPSEMIEQYGESCFRDRETEILKKVCREGGQVIATGGGAVVRKENRAILRENSIVVYLRRPVHLLAVKGRPISGQVGVEALYRQRAEKYEWTADLIVENNRIFGNLQKNRKRNRRVDTYPQDIRRFAEGMRRIIWRYINENLSH